MSEQVLLRNHRPDRPATFDEYRQSGGYEALEEVLKKHSPEDVVQMVKDAGLRGRGGAGFPTGIKWEGILKAPFPRYVVCNTDEMEPGTFKDRVLVNADPHLCIEGMILAGYAASAKKAFFFIRPSYMQDADLVERELEVARQAGCLGRNILGSDFSFEIVVHRSAGRYICGEASAMLNAIMGNRPYPMRGGGHMTEGGLWNLPTLIDNVETLACVPNIVQYGAKWFRDLAATERGTGTKLYTISGKVRKPGCYELPAGTRFREILEESAGGMSEGSELKAFIPGGASTPFLPRTFMDVRMDYDDLKEAGRRFGTGAIMVFDQNTCLVAATLNIIEYFARESCGWCTPCREGLPYIRDILWRIEAGEGGEEFIPILREMAQNMSHSYCAFAPGAVQPLIGLLEDFEEEIHEHRSHRACPFMKI